ncbi:ATP-binding cassette domain-containing protein [Mangrovicoccus ximenensis]|uniref:hypothetical protein n=1 Tax=Mangrovicoccus ximenensis TaxID=1911570 RepID=UPI0038B3406D
MLKPRLLLLDEPLANLDARLRDEVRWLIRDVQQQSGITAFYVTHDQSEAMAMSDKVAVMKAGRVAQFATPREIYQRPTERYVADFTGEANVLACAGIAPGPEGRMLASVGGTQIPAFGVAGLAPGRARAPKGNRVKISRAGTWRLTATLGSPETPAGASGRVIFSA